MKKHSKLLTVILIFTLIFSFTACGGGSDETTDEPPAATAMWADEYDSMMESGQKRDYPNYDALLQPLKDYQTETGSKYIYCVAPVDPDNLDGDYELTIDASDPPDKWGENYGFEIQFKEAAEGEVAAARSAWEDGDKNTWCWSAFAPVKDEDGEVVAIVGIDYPAPIVADYPEWDRDNKAEWNGEEGPWPEDMPEELQKFVNECKDRVATLADQLSKQKIEVQS